MHVESGELHGLPSSVPTSPFVADPKDLTRGLSFLHRRDEHKNSGLRAEHKQRWLPLDKSAVEIGVARTGCPVAPRRGLSSASPASRWPALSAVDALVLPAADALVLEGVDVSADVPGVVGEAVEDPVEDVAASVVAEVGEEAVEGEVDNVDAGFVADVDAGADEGVVEDEPIVLAEIDVGDVAESFEEERVLPPHFRDRCLTVSQWLILAFMFSASHSLAPSIGSRSESSNSESH